ncbi:MAG TPA: 2-dehydropantoate 2-reductase [Dongiaceae bacterium]|nr:2-dehydropantoate 2-reductase [Dongiaceae bacterium]
MPDHLKHAILGVGGVGGLIGACLAHSGDSVTAIVRRESLNAYPEQLQLESPFGNFSTRVAHSAEVPPVEVLWIAVKATQLEQSLAAITNPEKITAIVPLLNGLDHIALLRKKYGPERVIPATIAVESERVAPGHFVHRSPFAILNVSSAGRPLLGSTLDALQKIGFECHFVDDEATLMWTKIVFLAPLALATTAFDQPIGGVLANPEWKAQWGACVRETCAVAKAEGAKVDANIVFSRMSAAPSGMRSSMQKDVARGNPPELDAIAGPILRGGSRHGIDVHATKGLADAVEARSLSTSGRPSP